MCKSSAYFSAPPPLSASAFSLRLLWRWHWVGVIYNLLIVYEASKIEKIYIRTTLVKISYGDCFFFRCDNVCFVEKLDNSYVNIFFDFDSDFGKILLSTPTSHKNLRSLDSDFGLRLYNTAASTRRNSLLGRIFCRYFMY